MQVLPFLGFIGCEIWVQGPSMTSLAQIHHLEQHPRLLWPNRYESDYQRARFVKSEHSVSHGCLH